MRFSFIFLLVALLFLACTKQGNPVSRVSHTDSLPGKWRYVEYFISSGPPGSWYAVNPVTQWIELKENGAISSNLDPFKDAVSYQLPDSNKIKFIIPAKPDGYLLFQYKIDTTDGALILSPLNPICIEGCAIKFKR